MLLPIALGMAVAFAAPAADAETTVLWIEAEQFADKGGWVNDPQFVDLMGSPYLLANAMGKPVSDAVTEVTVPRTAQYRFVGTLP